MENNNLINVKVKKVRPISAHNQALYDTGKEMMAKSIETSHDFCKFMIGTSTSAIPVYLGILTFIQPEKFKLGIPAGWTVVIPAFGFLLTSLVFTFGYMPVFKYVSLDEIHHFGKQRDKIIEYRKWSIWIGILFFLVSVVWGIVSIAINIGVR